MDALSAHIPAAIAANEMLPCEVSGCQLRRYGLSHRCETHAHELHQRRAEASRKAVETRARNFPNWRKPKPMDYERWQYYAAQVVKRAKVAGVLPNLAGGEYACVDCGGIAEQYDHRDYGRPLDVEPVCRACNVRRGAAKFPQASDFQFKKRT